MDNLISIENTNFGSLLVEFLILVVFSLVVIWFITTIAADSKNMKEKLAYKQRIKMAVKNALIGIMIIFSIYVTVFVAINGKEAFHWGQFPIDNSNTYWQILPQILLYISFIITYIWVNNKLKKELKKQ